MLFLCYPRCTTCRRAQQWLEERGIAFELRDITVDNPSAEELRLWWERSGLPLKRLWNTSGLKYRELNMKERLPHMSDEEQLLLLSTDGMLVKRPLLVSDDRVLVGFRENEWAEKLG